MPQLIHPPVKTLTCERCGTAELDETVRESWHCVSPGILGSTEVYWLCPHCYAATYGPRASKDKGVPVD